MRKLAILYGILMLAVIGAVYCIQERQLASAQATTGIPRGLVLQEGAADLAASYGVSMAAKRWPASYCHLEGDELICPQLDAMMEQAETFGVTLVPGLMHQNETYTGAPSALPQHWDAVCWQGPEPGCGPNYANPVTRTRIFNYVRGFAKRYDGQFPAFQGCIGDDGERRFCKRQGQECTAAYEAAGLTARTWELYVADYIRVTAESFTQSEVLMVHSGMGTGAWELGRDVKLMAGAGLGLMSSGLYPGQCRGNSYGGECNPLEPLMVDWMVPAIYPDTFMAMEQSWRYTGNMAALSWLWAITHGADQIHAQRETLRNSTDTEWRESVSFVLAHPEAALWIARDLDRERCIEWYGLHGDYCGEEGDWSINVTDASVSGELGFDVGTNYMGWVARRGPVELRTTIAGPAQIIVWYADGTRESWQQTSGELVLVDTEEWVHRVEVRPVLPPTMTPTATRTPTATQVATKTPTFVATSTPTATKTPTATPTPAVGWRITGKWGPFRVDLIIQPLGD